MGKTAIEYGDRTWNFYPGCNGPDGKPCSYCWAQNRVLPRMACEKCRTGKPHLHPERLEEPTHVRKPSRFLVCFTGDLFGDWVPEPVLRYAFDVMRGNSRHTFLCLTKQPQNLPRFNPFPDNCFVGVSITNVRQALAAVTPMAEVEAKVKFVSYEPLLDEVPCKHIMNLVQWVIIGAQTPYKGSTAPKVEWVREIVEAADKVGVRVFLKNSLSALRHITPLWARGSNGMMRQEVPR